MRLSRTTFLALLLTHLPSQLNASTISSGFYVGFGVGMERLNGKRNEWLETDPNSYDPQTFTHDKQMKKNSHLANFFGGYLYRYRNFAIAGEAFYELGKVEDKIDRDWVDKPGTNDFKGFFAAALEKKNGFGFKANIGGVIYDSIFLYGLIGISATQLRYVTSSIYVDTVTPAVYNHQTVKRKLAYGFDWGLGIQKQLNQWRLGTEIYVRKIKNQSFSFNYDPGLIPQPIVYAKLKPSAIGMTLKAVLTF